MAKAKKQGLITRLIMGSEKSETYARDSLPSNRWELFWDIFKGRFSKLVGINLLILLFCIPLIFLILFRTSAITGYGTTYPFSQGFGVGYQAPPSFIGFAEAISVNVNMYVMIFLPIAVMVACIGIAGGAYVIRNMVWTEGIFVSNDFWRGIRHNIKHLLLIGLIYSLIFYMVNLSLAYSNQLVVLGQGTAWLLTLCKIFLIVFMVFCTLVALHMIAMTVTYQLKFRQLLKNAVLLTVGLIPQNLIMVLLAAIPFALLFLGGIISTLGTGLLIFFGISYFLLVWTIYCQWIYDKFFNEKIGVKTNRGIYEKVKGSDSKSLQMYSEQIARVGQSSLSSRPIKPITDEELRVAELPTVFSRSDLENLRQSKQAIYDAGDKYVQEHMNDPKYKKIQEEKIETEKQKAEREKRIAKARKALNKRKF